MKIFLVIIYCNVFNVWPKTTLLLPVWPRDAKSLDTRGRDFDYYCKTPSQQLLDSFE